MSQENSSYLHTSLSPYRLNEDALTLIKELNENFSQETEKKALILLNASALHPKMSMYQLSLSRKELGDCYFKNGFYQSALEQYQSALSENPKIAVKKRIKEILAMNEDEKKSSLAADTIDNVLNFPEYKKLLDERADQIQKELDDLWAGHEAERELYEEAKQQAIKEPYKYKSVEEKTKEMFDYITRDGFSDIQEENLDIATETAAALALASAKFIDGLERFNNIKAPDGISQETWEDFSKLYCKAKEFLDENELKMLDEALDRIAKTHKYDDTISVEEHSLINLRGMIISAIYRKNKQNGQ